MSVPSHNLYDFIHQVTENRYWTIWFSEWGNKHLEKVTDYIKDQNQLDSVHGIPRHLRKVHEVFPQQLLNTPYFTQVRLFQPVLFCHDQEPLNFDLYQDHSDYMIQFQKIVKEQLGNDNVWAPPNWNLRNVMRSSWQQCWTLLHSEINSNELTRYESTGRYRGAYWWSHAMIARDWYRYAQYDKTLCHKHPDRLFLIYARDTTGSRQYRQDFLNALGDISTHCQIGSVHGRVVEAQNSALYDSIDINSTAFQVVLETVFEKQRIHLTEKTLRPLACGQPFLLAGGPGSLALLRCYGFETFAPWINEDYDCIDDPHNRLHAIIKEMHRISNLPSDQQKSLIDHTRKIALRNQKKFFSDEFYQHIISELKQNVELAWQFHQGEIDPGLWWNQLRWRRKHTPEWFTKEKRQNLKLTLPLIRQYRSQTT